MADIHSYRQPMVTATGIFLGFMLNFTSNWIKDAFTKNMFRDCVTAISIMASLFLLLLVLIRILRMKYPTEPEKFYRKTLVFFFFGISIPFLGFLIVIIDRFVVSMSTGAAIPVK
jgi:hypothetical protein